MTQGFSLMPNISLIVMSKFIYDLKLTVSLWQCQVNRGASARDLSVRVALRGEVLTAKTQARK